MRAVGDAFADRGGQVATFGVAACLAFALKTFYAQAEADDLDFVLAPTTALVEAVTGLAFEYEPGVGYLSRDAAYLIAPACAGLNFTVAAFSTLALGFTPRRASLSARAARLATFAALALALTPLANATRITLDLTLVPPDFLPIRDLSRSELHRLEGVVVYLVSLWLLHATAERALAPRSPAYARILLPLVIYLALTLAVPMLNPFASGPAPAERWPHARAVLAASLSLALAWAGLRSLHAGLRSRRRPLRLGRPRCPGNRIASHPAPPPPLRPTPRTSARLGGRVVSDRSSAMASRSSACIPSKVPLKRSRPTALEPRSEDACQQAMARPPDRPDPRPEQTAARQCAGAARKTSIG